MNENIDLTKILKNCPDGWKLWSPIFGKVEFNGIFKTNVFVNVKEDNEPWSFYSDATFSLGNIKSVEIMLYPSKDQRDWNKFTAPWYKERFDPNTLQPYMKVLVRDAPVKCWRCSFFSHKNVNTESSQYKYATPDNSYVYCIPYNDDTKHLVGTKEEAPEYYRYWED